LKSLHLVTTDLNIYQLTVLLLNKVTRIHFDFDCHLFFASFYNKIKFCFIFYCSTCLCDDIYSHI